MTDDKACGHDELETLRQVIAGEPARTAAAVAAAREETRDLCVREVLEPAKKRDPGFFGDHPEEIVASRLRRIRLTATPLADRIKALEAENKALRHDADAEWGASATERETLRDERDALRAQVEAARAGLSVIAAWSEGPEVSGSFDEPCSAQYARDTLAAMDGAKPEPEPVTSTWATQAENLAALKRAREKP